MKVQRIIASAALAIVFASALPAQRQQGPSGAPPDFIYYNAKVVTVDDQFSYAQAVAIAGDKFTAVGTNDSVRELAGPNTKLVDLRGMTVIPGLTDNHLHNAGGGPGVDLSRTRSVDEVLKAVGDRVKRAEPGEVVLSNSDWHEAQLKEQRLPLRRDLDKVAPMTPVVMVRGRPRIRPQFRRAGEVEHHEDDGAAARRPHHAVRGWRAQR
jgi:hypothetical protein